MLKHLVRAVVIALALYILNLGYHEFSGVGRAAVVENVAHGAALLDVKYSNGWAHRIDTATLSMTSPYRCILGQLGAEEKKDYYHMLNSLKVDGSIRHGFSGFGWRNRWLNQEWKKAIAARLS